MECCDVQSQLSSWLDGELTDDDSSRIQEHVESCSECHSVELQLRSVHTELKETLDSERVRAQWISEQVLVELTSTARSPVLNLSQKSNSRKWIGSIIACLLSASAGFLLAVVWLQSQEVAQDQIAADQQQIGIEKHVVDSLQGENVSTNEDSASLHLVRATGSVSIFPPTEQVWTPVDTGQLATYSCPSQGAIRTEQGSLCELKTLKGDVIRLNESSEIRVRSDDELELIRGQLWCRTSPDSKLKVFAPADLVQADGKSRMTFLCHENSESFASCESENSLQVATASGTVDIVSDSLSETVLSGEMCRVTNGKVELRSNLDSITAARWMVPLLTLTGHGDPELNRRVDAMLAQIGRTKLSNFYERELRNLGEYGSLPLIRFVQAEESQLEQRRRQFAMSIIADTAPIWMVPDLIELLEDDNSEVRYLAASGLSRLTGENQGYKPEDWRTSKPIHSGGLSDWQLWWQQNRFSCPMPPFSASVKE